MKKISFFTILLAITFNYHFALAIDEKKTFSLHNVSLIEAIELVEDYYKFKIDYKGKSSNARVSVVINDLTIYQSLRKIFSSFEISNWTSYANKSSKEISIRIINFKNVASEKQYEPIILTKFFNSDENSSLTKEDIYYFKEQSEEEIQKEKLSREQFNFEEILLLENYTKAYENNKIIENVTLPQEEIEKLIKENKYLKEDHDFSPNEIELIKREMSRNHSEVEKTFAVTDHKTVPVDSHNLSFEN